jgi:hypothetical protein
LTRFIPPEDWLYYEREGGHQASPVDPAGTGDPKTNAAAAVDALLGDLWS